MRNSAFVTLTVVAVAMLAALLAGCSGEDQAGLNRQTEDARRYYEKAIGLLSAPAQMTSDELPQLDPARPEALQALQQAESTLSKALADNPDASDIAKAPAQALLAQVQQTLGDYHAGLAGVQFEQAHRAVLTGLRQLGTVQGYRALEGYHAGLAQFDLSELQSLQEQSRQAMQRLTQRQTELSAQLKQQQDLARQTAEATRTLRNRAIDLRNQSRAATGQQILTLGRQADELERQVIANTATIQAAQAAAEDVERDLEQVRRELMAENARLEMLKARQAEMQTLAGENQQAQQVQHQSAVEAFGPDALADDVQQVLRHLQAGLSEAERAVRSYQNAQGAIRQALTGLRARAREASSIASDKPDAMPELIGSLRSGGAEAAALAQQASIHLALADARQQRLDILTKAGQFAQQVQQAAQAAGAQAPAGTGELAQMAGDTGDLLEKARQEYQAAIADLERAENLLPREPVNQRALAWSYQGQQVRANYSLYRLTGETGYLGEANRLLAEIRTREGDNPYAQDVLDLDRLVGRQGPAPAPQTEPAEQ